MCGKVAKTSKGPIPQPFLIRLGEVNGYLWNIVGNRRLFGFLPFVAIVITTQCL